MKLRLLIIPALMATAMFAQGQGGFGTRRSKGSSGTYAPPSTTQLGTRQVNMIAAFLGLDNTQTTYLLGLPLVGDLGTEQTNLQSYAAALQADYTAVANAIANGKTPPTASITDIATQNGKILTARQDAATEVVTDLNTLSPPLTTAQQAKLPALVNMLLSGSIGGPGFFRSGRF